MNPVQVRMALASFHQEQNLLGGLLAGGVAAVIGAGLWAVITVVTEYQIGWMAVGVACLVGIALWAVGKGIDPIFGGVGAVLALAGCVLGNFLSIAYFLAEAEGMGLGEVLVRINPAAIPDLMIAAAHPLDLVFYGLAPYLGYAWSLRRMSEEELQTAMEHRAAPVSKSA